MLVVLSRHQRGDVDVSKDGISTVSFEETKDRQVVRRPPPSEQDDQLDPPLEAFGSVDDKEAKPPPDVIWVHVAPGKDDPYYAELHDSATSATGTAGPGARASTSDSGDGATATSGQNPEARQGAPFTLGDDCGCFKGTMPIIQDGKCQPFQLTRKDLERAQRTEQGWNIGAYPFLTTARWTPKQQWVVVEDALQEPHPNTIKTLAELREKPLTARDLQRLNGGMPTPEDLERQDRERDVARNREAAGAAAATTVPPAPASSTPDRAVCDGEVLGGLVVLGVLITVDDLEMVEIHRATLARAEDPCVRIYYVIGAKELTDEQKRPVLQANATWGDFLFLEGTKENMNWGKSLDWVDFAADRFLSLRGGGSSPSPRRDTDVESAGDTASAPACAFLGKLDLDAFLHAKILVKELSRLPRSMLFYGGEAAHSLDDGRTVKPNNVFEGIEFFLGDTKHVGELYVMSADLVRVLIRGRHWLEEKQRRGDEDTIVSNQIYWALDEFAARGEVDRFHFASDWYRLVDHPFMTKRMDVSGDWIQPMGRHAEVLILHQVKSKTLWKNVNQWLDRTKNGTSVCERAT